MPRFSSLDVKDNNPFDVHLPSPRAEDGPPSLAPSLAMSQLSILHWLTAKSMASSALSSLVGTHEDRSMPNEGLRKKGGIEATRRPQICASLSFLGQSLEHHRTFGAYASCCCDDQWGEICMFHVAETFQILTLLPLLVKSSLKGLFL